MFLENGTTVAVMDGHRLRLFRNIGHEDQPELLEVDHPVVPPSNAGSGGRHTSSAANPDNARHNEDNFVAAVADLLNSQMRNGAITKLFVVADPRTLGELRHSLSGSLVIGSMAKNMMQQDAREIAQAILCA